MTPTEALVAERMSSLLLCDDNRGRPVRRSPAEVVGWFGAMQAQDLSSGMWSVGIRTGGNSDEVARSLRSYDIIRTWPMRGTIHLVSARDVRWMLACTGTRALQRVHARWANLGLDASAVERATRALHDRLVGQGPVPRADALAAVDRAGVDVTGQRGYHVIWYASQIGVTCLGPLIDGQPTLVLLDEVVPRSLDHAPDDPLAELAKLYVRGHGPVTHSDFARWAGITATEARRALADQEDVVEVAPDERVGDGPAMWRCAVRPTGRPAAARALPGYDEYILGYKDRALFLDPQFADRIVPGGNGVFRPTLVLGGRVRGTWRRITRTKVDRIEISAFGTLTPAESADCRGALERYGRFTGRPIEVRMT